MCVSGIDNFNCVPASSPTVQTKSPTFYLQSTTADSWVIWTM